MSTWTGITVGEFELCSMQDDYEQWYFRNSDRIRDIVGGDKDGDHRNSFIGYRAEVGKIRRRMELQG
ncbi:HEPN/Toprim-associated domain-containing protein, partial [Escherichia coli]|nr:HEPN/Toprim-associated domain-containing protein [Escherichia coli]